MTTTEPRKTKVAERRLTFTQSQFAAEYVDSLNDVAGVSKADAYNTAIKLLAAVVSASRRGDEIIIRHLDSGDARPDYALDVLLGDILTALRTSREQQ